MSKVTTWKALKKAIKIPRLIFLIVLISSNTLAWFIYSTKVNTSIDIHVKSWNIVIKEGENEISNNLNIEVDDMYPGMEDYKYSLDIYNNSEVNAQLDYQILKASIMGNVLTTEEGRIELGEDILNSDYTSDELETILSNKTVYPFAINISLGHDVIELEEGNTTFEVDVTWDYESGNDELDTYWGKTAATFSEQYPNQPSISLQLKLTVIQTEDVQSENEIESEE